MIVDIPRLLALLGIRNWKPKGDEVWAACPFPDHDEEEPSWSIGADGRNHCFGCERGGSVFDLVMEVIGISFPGASSWVKENNIIGKKEREIPKRIQIVSRGADRKELKHPLGVVFDVAEWTPSVKKYAQSRGITREQVDRWGLGCGKGGRMIGRLYLPTADRDGRLLNYTGRAVMKGMDPRYKGPHESEEFDLSGVFGERHWPKYVQRKRVYVTEGGLNAMALERAGLEHIAGLGGSRVDSGQLLRLARFSKITVVGDPDRAGEKAVGRLFAALVRWRNVDVVFPPDDMDACDVEAKRGLDELRRLVCRD